MAPRPRRSPRHFTPPDPDELGNSVQSTPAPSNAGLSDAPIPALALAKYNEEALQTMTMFCMDLFLQAQASRPKPAGREDYFDVAGATSSNCIPFAVPCLHLCSFVAKRVAPLPWFEFKVFPTKESG